MQSEPFQPWDTRLTVYGLRNHIQLNQETVHEWRLWRNQALNIPPDLQGRSDVALSWMAADIQLLNALVQTSFGGVRESNTDFRNEVYSYGIDWPNYVGGTGTRLDYNSASSTPYTYIALAILNFQTGFNVDLATGNYLPQMLNFRPGVDYGAPNRLYQPEPGPPAYVQ